MWWSCVFWYMDLYMLLLYLWLVDVNCHNCATDSFVMLRAYRDKGTTYLMPNSSTIRKNELLLLNVLRSRFIMMCRRNECEANFEVDEDWSCSGDYNCQSPQILGAFHKFLFFMGLPLPSHPGHHIAHNMDICAVTQDTTQHIGWKLGWQGYPLQGDPGQGYPGCRVGRRQWYPEQKHQAWELLSNRLLLPNCPPLKLGIFFETLFIIVV